MLPQIDHQFNTNAPSHRTFQPQNLPADAMAPPAVEPAVCWRLWEVRQAYFYQCCLRWLHGNQADAEDAFNTAALAIWRTTQEQTATIINPMGWLTGVVRHTCLDIHRKGQREASHTVALDAIGSETGVDRLSSSPSCRSPESIFLQREECTYIHQTINALPGRLCTPVIMRFYRGCTYEEIAVQLKLSPDTVRKRIQEARTVLDRQRRQYLTGQAGPAGLSAWVEEDTRLTTLPAVNPDVNDGEAVLKPRVAPLRHVSKREEQKLRTLRAYVATYPSGWKKRLALANQLCKMGEQAEAVVMYEQVLAKQPQLLSVWVQIGRIYQALKHGQAAIVAYKRALPLATTDEMRSAIVGLIASLTGDVAGP